ncbi:MAG: SpoIIE family protein phosphatase [Synergistaceae bacterium]|jgi:sigma-B regulation protein RsbU (phosphoserine phosphatase)|nr:SpoIIE family protein phosphatase [Synergistaceae bacterium]
MTAGARYTLRTKFAILFGAFAFVVGALICSITYVSYRDSMLEHYGKYALGAATLAASILDPDELLRYAATLERDERYSVIEYELGRIRESLGVKYLYVQMPISGAEYIYLFDIYAPDEPGGTDTSLGTRGDYDENFETAKRAMSTGKPTRELDITHSVYGYLASAYVPISREDEPPFAYVGADISMNYILGFLTRYMAFIVSATSVVMALCFTALFLLVRRSVVNPIHAIAGKTSEFTRRVSDEKFEALQIRANDEIGDLAASINRMFEEIRDFASRLAEETARRERAQSELDMARGIQEGVLPKVFPPFRDFPKVEVFASMNPAKGVGGDFYDFFIVGGDSIAIVIADTSGKGVPAALFMMVARILIKNRALLGDEPHELLESVNRQLCQDNDAGMFVTVFVGIFDTKLKTLKYANAGHNPPLILRGGRAEWLPVEPGMALGVMENISFVAQDMEFGERGLLLLYTDGVTEAMNGSGELFDESRLLELMTGIASGTEEMSAKDAVEAVNAAVLDFSGGAEQADDVTVLALRERV